MSPRAANGALPHFPVTWHHLCWSMKLKSILLARAVSNGYRSKIFNNDGLDHLTLKPGELVTAVHLPQELAGDQSAYEKARIRGSIDFPLAGVAVRLRKSVDGTIEDLAIALTAVNPFPQIVSGLEGLIGTKLSEESAMQVRDTVRKQAKPMRTTTVAPWYRRRVIGAIAKRLLEELAG